MQPEKRCSSCNETKPASDFGLRANGRWLRSQCRVCERAYGVSYRLANPEYVRSHNRSGGIRRRGLTVEEFTRLEAHQGGVCAICQRPQRERNRRRARLDVDHDHLTLRVRGLLCSPCNAGIGLLGDDPALIRAAAAYLEQHVGHPIGIRSQEAA